MEDWQAIRKDPLGKLNIPFSSIDESIMSIVPSIVKTVFTKRFQDLKAQETEAIATNKATAKLIGNQRSEGIVRGFTLI